MILIKDLPAVDQTAGIAQEMGHNVSPVSIINHLGKNTMTNFQFYPKSKTEPPQKTLPDAPTATQSEGNGGSGIILPDTENNASLPIVVKHSGIGLVQRKARK